MNSWTNSSARFKLVLEFWVKIENLNETPIEGDVELDVGALLDKVFKSIIPLSQAMNATSY